MKEEYYGKVIARSIMFTDEIENLVKKLESLLLKLNLNTPNLLEIIYETFLSYENKGYLTNQGKNNICFFLSFINQPGLLDDSNINCQEVIGMLKCVNFGNRLTKFYRHELAIRSDNQSYENPELVSDKKIERMVRTINISILNDLDVLFGLLDDTDLNYWNGQMRFIISPNFIESARYLMHENHSLVLDNNFKNRLCATLEIKESMSKKYHKNFFRRITLDKEYAYLGKIEFGKNDKSLYKRVMEN